MRGYSTNNIANDINGLGWPTKVYHSKRSGKTTGGGKWTDRQIVDTLRNPVYIGRFADGTDTRDGCHEPIVDQATFETVPQQLDARRTTDGRIKRVHHDHLAFRQTIACPQCGRFLTTYQTTKHHSDAAGFYSCRSTAGGHPRCKDVHYPAWKFEQAVCEIFNDSATWRDLHGIAATDELIEQVMQAWSAMRCTTKRARRLAHQELRRLRPIGESSGPGR